MVMREAAYCVDRHWKLAAPDPGGVQHQMAACNTCSALQMSSEMPLNLMGNASSWESAHFCFSLLLCAGPRGLLGAFIVLPRSSAANHGQ
jgi:hypothetical protein